MHRPYGFTDGDDVLKFEHKVTIEAPKQQVQDFLNDFNKSAYCVPGLRDLKDLGDDAYEGTIRVRIGPIGLNVGGKAQIERQAEGWRVKGEGNDRRVGAGMTANVEAKIEALAPSRTEVEIIADVQFAGRLAELGQPLIKRKADSFVAEFAENLRKAVSAS
jgi:carbon monoxide dehydrogenase subunit G